MAQIPIGVRGESQLVVTSEYAIQFLNNQNARVLATPWLIAQLEITARNSVKSYLLDEEDTVGTQVNIRHLAATPMGMTATFRTEVISVENRRILFNVEAFDHRDKLADGTHERAIINVERFASRVAEKRKGKVAN